MPTVATPPNVNDGSTNPPRLVIYGNSWGLLELPKLPHERPWTFEETIEKMIVAGFEGYQGGPGQGDAIRSAGLRFSVGTRISTPGEADATVKAAAQDGADSVTAHAGWGLEDDREMDEIVIAILEASSRHGVPVYIETHRATITQDIWRTLQLVRRIPQIRFNGDFSHFYTSHEMTYQGFDNVRRHLTPILERTAFFHGRIGNGECMQVDVGDGATDQNALNFKSLWTEAVGYWKRNARPGDILPFAPELGPPSSRYSITYTSADGRDTELSDRWQQSLVLKRLAEEAFAAG